MGQSYLAAAKNIPPQGTFNATNRAYPDVTLVGHNFLSINSGLFGITVGPVDGTSASSPSTAALFTLIVDARLNAGLSPLGLVTPSLYQLSGTDASSGLGSINWPAMAKAMMSN